MAGATGSNGTVKTGRTNRGEGRTRFWAQVPPGQANFNGPAIVIAEVAANAHDPDDYEEGESFLPSNAVHGLLAVGWSGGGPANFGGDPAAGVIARGGRNQGTGVLGLGGGVPEPGNGGEGGIGVHGLGGAKADFFADPVVPPGAGVVGQGGRQSERENQARRPHAAGVIGIGGGTGRNLDLLPQHPLSATGGAGVYGQGADAETVLVSELDGDGVATGSLVPSGPLAAGAGVVGRGGVADGGRGAPAPGVVGLSGGVVVPPIAETAGAGVHGRGRTGVRGHGEIGRGGEFSADDHPQLHLRPQPFESPLALRGEARAGDLLVTLERDPERGTESASLWFCKRGGDASQSSWVKLA